MLGHGDRADQHVPTVIEALRDRRVVAIAAGDGYSMVLTDEGEVLSFGDGWHGQLGHGDLERQLVPTTMGAFRGRRVVAIAIGGTCVVNTSRTMNLIVQVDDGTVFASRFIFTYDDYGVSSAVPLRAEDRAYSGYGCTSTDHFTIHGGRDGVGGAF